MKTLLCLVALTAFAHSAVLVEKSARNNINIGSVIAGDRLLTRSYLYRPAVPNTIQSEDFIYRGNATTRISAIQAFEQGYPQYAAMWVRSGGIGYPNVTLTVQSARGWGYYYLIDIWGR